MQLTDAIRVCSEFNLCNMLQEMLTAKLHAGGPMWSRFEISQKLYVLNYDILVAYSHCSGIFKFQSLVHTRHPFC